ncbi:MAG: type II toxin-antitoxin system prevent-host-death family antitoxin [Wenzhouxiangella sp.]|nr:MAG: type II toxin-antitoxin system prevent-host-death family antitoxin [Wenzhouxiangella sp.]
MRDLKDHLSSYVRRVSAGEEVVLTSRRRPVARILPVQEPRKEPSDEEARGLSLVHWSREKPLGGRQRPRIEEASAASTVLEDRR